MLQNIMSNITLAAPLIVMGSFLVAYIIIPKIIWIVNNRDLIVHPEERSSHKKSTPTMAGVAFFLTLILALFFLKTWDIDAIGLNLIAALTIIFVIGLKDDLVVSSPRAKLGGELVATLFVLLCSCMQVTTFHGFLGIDQIPMWFAYGFGVLMILTIINSFNLIDGIDGLASTIGIVIFITFSVIFYTTGLYFYFLLSLSLIAMLLAYLRYNFSGTKKIFMGDTGSLIIGFCIGFFTLKFLAMDASLFSEFSFKLENKLIIIAAILYIPLLDTLRVIGVRLLNKKSPFYPDRNHIHHILIDSGLTHIKASLFLGFLNLLMVALFVVLSSYLNSIQMLLLFGTTFIFFLGIFHKLRENITSKNSFKHLVRAIHFIF